LNWALRYDPLLPHAEHANGLVLDAGAGVAGLGTYLPDHPIVAVDLRFFGAPRAALGGVCASVLRLPFPDGSFSTTIASDLFEHLDPSVRHPALLELLRVTRDVVVVAFPSGSAAMDDDRWLARRLRLLHRTLPDWLQEHLALNHPVASDLVSWCPPGLAVGVSKNANRVLHRWVLLLELLPVVGPSMHRLAWQPKVHRLRGLPNRGRTYREVVEIRLPGLR